MRLDVISLLYKEDVAGLQRLLVGDDDDVRLDAIEALAKLGGKAVPILEAALSDDSEVVRQSAGRCLGFISDTSVIPALIRRGDLEILNPANQMSH